MTGAEDEPAFCKRFAVEVLQRIPPSKVSSFTSNWASMLKHIANGPLSPAHAGIYDNVLEVSDACSGTGVFSFFVGASLDAASQVFGQPKVLVRHKMACEKEPPKQKFLIYQHQPELMVGDIIELCNPMATDIRNKDQQVPVPSTPLFGSGFSCKD